MPVIIVLTTNDSPLTLPLMKARLNAPQNLNSQHIGLVDIQNCVYIATVRDLTHCISDKR